MQWLISTWINAQYASLFEKCTCQNGHHPKSTNNKCWREYGEKEHFCTVGSNINWYSHYGRQYGDSLKILGIKPPYDPAIPLLSIYPEETKTRKDTCSSHCSLQHYLTRTWKQPRCPSTDARIKKLIHIHNGISLSHKKEHIWISSD